MIIVVISYSVDPAINKSVQKISENSEKEKLKREFLAFLLSNWLMNQESIIKIVII